MAGVQVYRRYFVRFPSSIGLAGFSCEILFIRIRISYKNSLVPLHLYVVDLLYDAVSEVLTDAGFLAQKAPENVWRPRSTRTRLLDLVAERAKDERQGKEGRGKGSGVSGVEYEERRGNRRQNEEGEERMKSSKGNSEGKGQGREVA